MLYGFCNCPGLFRYLNQFIGATVTYLRCIRNFFKRFRRRE